MGEAMISIELLLASPGPPRLFEGGASEVSGGGWWLLGIVIALGAAAAAGVFCIVRRRVINEEQLAMKLLSRRLGLKGKQRAAVERLGARSGVAPVGLLVCESAFVRAARGERILPGSQLETKPVLLTGAELIELGSVAERLFGPGALEQGSDAMREHEEEADDEASQWVA